MTPTVELVEVGPRDGLQNEPEVWPVEDRVALIERLIEAGVKRLEAVSFVNPKRVPQMADGEAIMARLPRDRGVTYIGLVLNRRGFERAVACAVDQVNYVIPVTDAFAIRNQGASVEEATRTWEEIAEEGARRGLFCGVTLSAAFGCPFEGEVAPARVAALARRLAETGACEIALADTIGAAGPTDVARLIAAVQPEIGDVPLRVHFHDTRNTGIANAYAALMAGVRIIDASVGGLGGCPFAPNATGNVPSEDVLYMLRRAGVETGVSLDAMIAVAAWAGERLGRSLPAKLGRAGVFPEVVAARRRETAFA